MHCIEESVVYSPGSFVMDIALDNTLFVFGCLHVTPHDTKMEDSTGHVSPPLNSCRASPTLESDAGSV